MENNNQLETFANLHPHEAYSLDKKSFCNYVRKKICADLEDDDIKNLLINDMQISNVQ